MIVKILNRSASFNGSWLYHFHDKGSSKSRVDKKTTERVDSYGLRNLGTDDPEIGFKQMALTWHNANDLKAKAGISHKGRKCTKPLITIVLSYNSGYQPGAAEVERDVDAILTIAGLTDNQAVWVVHSDTANIHVHIIVNAVNPDNGTASQFDNKVAKLLQGWARNKEASIGLQCLGRDHPGCAGKSRKFISSAERRARERIEHISSFSGVADDLSAQIRQEWKELRDENQQEISDIYERIRLIRETGRVQRKIIKAQASAKIKNIYKRSKRPLFLTSAWLERNEWARLGRRTHAARHLFNTNERSLSGKLINSIHLSLSNIPNKKDFLIYLLSSEARRAGLEDWINHEYDRVRTRQSIKRDAFIGQIRSSEYECYISLSRYIQDQISKEMLALDELKRKHLEKRRLLSIDCNSRWNSINPDQTKIYNKGAPAP